MLGQVNPPGCILDFNTAEGVWGLARLEATGNQCLRIKALVQERVSGFLDGLASRKDEVKLRYRTLLQSNAEGLTRELSPNSKPASNAHPTLALV